MLKSCQEVKVSILAILLNLGQKDIHTLSLIY